MCHKLQTRLQPNQWQGLSFKWQIVSRGRSLQIMRVLQAITHQYLPVSEQLCCRNQQLKTRQQTTSLLYRQFSLTFKSPSQNACPWTRQQLFLTLSQTFQLLFKSQARLWYYKTWALLPWQLFKILPKLVSLNNQLFKFKHFQIKHISGRWLSPTYFHHLHV
jgi:hypothetical protein